MTVEVSDTLLAEVVVTLRGAGARFALLHGSRVTGTPAARVRWVATTRKIYADEAPRLRRSHREFVESVRRGR